MALTRTLHIQPEIVGSVTIIPSVAVAWLDGVPAMAQPSNNAMNDGVTARC